MPTTETNTMEDEYEYLIANSAENCKAIVEWMFSGEIQEFQPANGMWWDTAIIEKGIKYRRKKPQPTETKQMEDNYEILCADSAENCKTIVEWIFSCGTQVKSELDEEYSHSNVSLLEIGRTYRRKKPQTDVFLTDPGEISRGILAGSVECMQGTVWLHATVHDTNFIATKLELGAKYRRKPGCKLPPKKTKKLVPRTAEELTHLIGKCLIRLKTTPGIVHLLIDNDYEGDQEHWEMCYIGEYVWGPMMKESWVEE